MTRTVVDLPAPLRILYRLTRGNQPDGIRGPYAAFPVAAVAAGGRAGLAVTGCTVGRSGRPGLIRPGDRELYVYMAT